MAIYSGFSHQKWWFSIVMLNYQRDEPPWIRAIGKTPGETLGFSMGIPLTWPSFGCWRPRHRQDHVSQGSGLVHWDTWNFRQNHGDFCHQAIGDLYEMDDHNPYSMSWPWHNGICPWKHCHSLSNTSFLQLAHACAGAASHSPLVSHETETIRKVEYVLFVPSSCCFYDSRFSPEHASIGRWNPFHLPKFWLRSHHKVTANDVMMGSKSTWCHDR